MKRFLAMTTCFFLLLSSCMISGCSPNSQDDSERIENNETTVDDNRVNPSQETDSSFLYDASISELKGTSSSIMDGQTVQIKGEAIGDARACDFDDAHKWLTLQESKDDLTYTITVYCSNNLVNSIDTFGSYGKRGTTLQVRGTFNISCKDHDGLTDIHAEFGTKVSNGSTSENAVTTKRIAATILALTLGAITFFSYVFFLKRETTSTEEQDEDDDEDLDES